MDIPIGFKVDSAEKYVLELKKNLYGLKQAGKTWFEHLSSGLEKIGFTQSDVDQCIFCRGNSIV
jgi:Reverse transcriptase (RNA-dependent DNA polymerase).